MFIKRDIIKYQRDRWNWGIPNHVIKVYYINTNKIISNRSIHIINYQLDVLISRFDLEDLTRLKRGIL